MDEPLRVLHIVGKMDYGGRETAIMKIYRSIDKSRVQFDFLVQTIDTCAYDEEIKSLGGLIHRVPYKRKKFGAILNRFSEIKSITSSQRYSIVHRHTHNAAHALIDLLAARCGGAKALVVHSSSTSTDRDILLHSVARHFLGKIASHRLAVSTAAGIHMYKNSEFTVYPNALDTRSFSYDSDARERTRNELGFEGKFVVGHIGRFSKEKNHELLVDVFCDVYKRDNNAHLLLVGDGPLRQNVEKRLNSLHLSESATLIRASSEIPSMLNAMDVLVFPSLYEGFPNVVLEAQCTGLPCILSDTITEEIRLTEDVKQLSILDGVESWVERVLEYRYYDRVDNSAILAERGYDINELCGLMLSFYEEKRKP